MVKSKKKEIKHPHVGWPLTIFILAIVIAILGLTSVELGTIFLLLAIFLVLAASFIRNL
jgi:hypothetical protein